MKRISVTLCLGIVLSVSFAQQRTLEQVRDIARAQLSSHVSTSNYAPVRINEMECLPSSLFLNESQVKLTDEAFYVCSVQGAGTAIVSTDERIPAILGYTDSKIEADRLPEGLQYLMEVYANDYRLLNDSGYQVASMPEGAAVTRTTGSSKGPLIKTTWGQRSPYNDLCPEINGQHCVSGCVATAMAQIMNYYKYPDNGEFDWDYMKDSYSGTYTSRQANAVAELMSQCGEAVYMNYGLNASGAYSEYVDDAFIDRFGYLKTMTFVYRLSASYDAWCDLLINEIDHNRPMYYDGCTSDSGHAFIIDGYDKQEYYTQFHVNYGWNGYCDGYYSIGDLQGFNYGQRAYIDVKTNKESVSNDPGCMQAGKQEVSTKILVMGKEHRISLNLYDVVYNSIYYKSEVKVKACFVNSKTGKKYDIATWTLNNASTGASYHPVCRNKSIKADMPLGTYSVQFFTVGKNDELIPITTTNDPTYFDVVDDAKTVTYVDLGLPSKTMWANMNVGALRPEDPGLFYAWGETTGTKSEYIQSTYTYYNNGWTKYNSKDGKKVLDPADDAATAAWGSEWSTPTYDQMKELVDKCSWQYTVRNNVVGYKVTGPNDNSIFLPISGLCGSNYQESGVLGYWTSTKYDDTSARILGISHSGYKDNQYGYREWGRTIRPVCNSSQTSTEVFYTSTDEKTVTPASKNVFFDAKGNALMIVSNTYKNGHGTYSLNGEVASIGEKAFADCTTLKSIEFPETMTKIGRKAFSFCTKLVSISLPESMTSISYGAFEECHDLTSVKLPSSLKTIEDYAFTQCTHLEKIDIPEKTTSIGNYAFYGCKRLTSIIVGKTPATITSSTFDSNTCSDATLTVPSGCKSAYQKAAYWKNFKNIQEVGGGVKAKGISIDKAYLTMTEGETATLTATLYPSSVSDKTVTWSTNDAKVATVSSAGVVTAVGEGSCRIKATTNDGTNLSEECVVTVKAKEVKAKGISINKMKVELKESETVKLVATIYPESATNKTVTWSSNNTNIATISEEGVVTAKKAGSCKVKATTTDGTNLSEECIVEVLSSDIKVTSIVLDKASIELKVADIETLTFTITPEDATDKSVTWKSDDKTVATVSSKGVVTAKKAGTCTITVTTKDGSNLSDECVVVVKEAEIKATSVSLNKNELSLVEGESETLKATVKPDDATDKSVTWTSSDKTVATVSSKGVVTAKKAGTCTITVTTNDDTDLTDECVVVVSPAEIKIESLTLSESEISINKGETYQLYASILPEDATNQKLEWKSSDKTIAIVEDGLIYGIETGVVTITARTTDDSNLSAECLVEVVKPTVLVESIDLDYTSKVLFVGQTISLTATIYPENADNQQLEWCSSDKFVAMVDDGYVVAIREGTCLITASATDGSGVSAECEITVLAGDAISTVNADDPDAIIYNLDGTRASDIHSGFYLILKSDGTKEKVFVR